MSDTPRLFTVMGEFMLPETLARVAKCSNVARGVINPILERKKGDKQEMYELILRCFPGISNLSQPDPEFDASYYTGLLDAYYTPNHSMVLFSTEISHEVGRILHNSYFYERNPRAMVSNYVRTAMVTAEGRRRLLKSIDDWRSVIERNVTGMYNPEDLGALDVLADVTRTNFAVKSEKIQSRHNSRWD
jgi:hypothetical protein